MNRVFLIAAALCALTAAWGQATPTARSVKDGGFSLRADPAALAKFVQERFDRDDLEPSQATGILVRYATPVVTKTVANLAATLKGVSALLDSGSEELITFTEALPHSVLRDLVAEISRQPNILWVEPQFPLAKEHPSVSAFEAQEKTNQLIVKLRAASADTPDVYAPQDNAQGLERDLSEVAQVRLTYLRHLATGATLLRLSNTVTLAEARAIAARLQGSSTVEYAEPDLPSRLSAIPNDPLYQQQWHYHPLSLSNAGGINLPDAWDVTTGASSLVVAVLDTGIVSGHPDFAGKLVAGYDFISDSGVAADGGGRDANPEDPGDACPERGIASSWHGTHVAGTVGAATNNGLGVAGVAPGVKIQAVRVLGRCGGTDSDIADGIIWAAGGTVPGVPPNATPAKIINLSLGGPGLTCPTNLQSAINTAVALGAVVVVAAGNNELPAVLFKPANCSGVVTVHAHTKFGDYAEYTNYGPPVWISAPGGQRRNVGQGPDGGVLSTINRGTTTQTSNDYDFYDGTSMAAPHVAGVAALVRTVWPNYTPATVKSLLGSSARLFPAGTNCSLTTNCGAGILDAYNAVTDKVNLDLFVEGAGTVTINPAGITCTNACLYSIPYNDGVTYNLVASPSPGFVFLGWLGDCSGQSTCSYRPTRARQILARFAPAGSVTQLAVSKIGTGTGKILSSPQGLNCGTVCSYNFVSNAVIVVRAAADPNSVFAGWSGACSGAERICAVTMNSAKTVTANFRSQDDYPDTAAQAASIAVNSSTPASLFRGSDQDWFKVALPGIGRWSIFTTGSIDTVGTVYAADGSTQLGTNDDISYPTNLNFGLTFTVPAAQTVLVRVTGYNTQTFVTTGPYTLVSTFSPTVALTVAKAGTGAGTVASSPAGISCGSTCSFEFNTGTAVTLTATPAIGSSFAGWSGACSGTGTCQVTMDVARTVTATFAAATAPPTTLELLTNPGFESGATGWVQNPNNIIAAASSANLQARTGSNIAWLSGYNNANDLLYQQVTIPADASAALFSFWYRVSTEDTTAADVDRLSVTVDGPTGTPLASVLSLSNRNPTAAWTQSQRIDLSGYRGQTIRLAFRATSDASRLTSFFIDDVSLQVTRGVSDQQVTGLWWNPSESGWGINFTQQGDIVFGTLFTYDVDGTPLWLVMSDGRRQGTGDTFTGALYRTTGPAFSSVPFNSSQIGVTQVGTMTVAFASNGTAQLNYTVNGAAVAKTISRQVYGSRAANCSNTTGARTPLTNYQDLWWNPNESGWGINITHQDQTLFGTLFNYDATGRGLWLVMSAGVRQPDGSYLGDLYRTRGPAFNAVPFNSSQVTVTPVGTMRLTFSNGENGTLSYSVNGVSVTKAITRQVFSSPVPACN